MAKLRYGGWRGTHPGNQLLVVVTGLVLALAGWGCRVEGFYLPGVAPQDFEKGDDVIVRVGRVASAKTHIPFDYYDLPLCPYDLPLAGSSRKDAPANLGEILSADRFHDAPFQLKALMNETCVPVCTLSSSNKQVLSSLIRDEYLVRIRIDNMPGMYLETRPLVRGVSLDTEVTYETPRDNGYPLGRYNNQERRFEFNNHITIWIMYHEIAPVVGAAAAENKVRIISVYVTAGSFDSGNDWETNCARLDGGDLTVTPQSLSTAEGIRTTYSVRWVETDQKWATRWDSLLAMDNYEHETNWSAIVNSILLSLLLGFLVAIILLRSVRNDLALLRELEAVEGSGGAGSDYDSTNVAWKLLSRDVFRMPRHLLLLSILHGNGAQLLWMLLLQMVFALLGFYSPSNRGAFLTYSFVVYACLALVGGRTAGKLYGSFASGQTRRTLVLGVALLVPGVAFTAFFLIDLVLWTLGSSGAVPFLTLLYIAFLWFGISLPLTFVGASWGFRSPTEWPVKPTKIPRMVPPGSCFLSTASLSAFGGITLYSMTFIQVFSIFQKIWLHQFVYMFGFLFLSGICFAVGCVEVAIITIYLTLCNEDYKWWWKSFTVPASSGLFMFFGTLIYQVVLTRELFEDVSFVTMWMMTTYLAMACFAVSLIAGSIGLTASTWFCKLIYSRCKPE
eukprot:CAMPEP_0198242754 /NCGR_PEP_ID=MMETSP1446-20131203/20293_1 /TAXON_ID=1461542 ORGANISM="Unidentified sp, Strain CCMP2111" /NCGR_SAMPLE_ID=MMETSP1446 /ASSEMBLY_ACC=CAM_ASM_001112 /LENGTH=673 /DNA_ID=CAMNT_0043926341 /DNA_START=230 /DNA_END=2251 /DNA_ORIENTATION=+